MSELPKIVWHRLRRTSAAPSGGAPAPSGSSKASEHPDADVLSAFLGQSLTERERTQVIRHLAECAECRQQVSLALPPVEDEAASAQTADRATRHRGWQPWPVLRWAALAASLVVVCVVVVLHRSELTVQKHPPPVVKPSPALAEEKTANGAVAGGATSVASGTAKDARKYEGFSRTSVRKREAKTASMKERPVPAVPLSQQKAAPKAKAESLEEVQSHPEANAVASETNAVPLPPPAPSAALAVRSRSEGQGSITSKVTASGALETLKKSSGGTPSEKSPSLRGVAGSAPRQGAEASGGEFARSKVDQVKPSAAKKPGTGGSAKESDLAEMKSLTAQAPPPRPSRASSATDRVTHTDRFREAKVLALRSAGSTLRWSISSSGEVQRSLDGGKTWEDVRIDTNVGFRAVSAVGANVWAGGSGGTLYHSTDYGAHWTQVSLTLDRDRPTVDVKEISFTDPEHGRVTTAAGETWVTSDGGEHWRKKQ